jgi:hypothetical protein
MLKTVKIIVVAIFAMGFAMRPVAVLAGEGKGEEGSHGSHHEAAGGHTHKGMKKGEKAEAQKTGATSGGATSGGAASDAAVAQQPGGHDHADHADDEEEGSH